MADIKQVQTDDIIPYSLIVSNDELGELAAAAGGGGQVHRVSHPRRSDFEAFV